MTDTPLPLPEGLRWIKIVCRLGRLAHDGVDADDKPDLLPTAGKVRLASSPARLRVQEPDGRWRSVSLDDREYTIRTDGELVDTEGRVGVWIPDPASELLDPRPYTLVATVTPTVGERWAAKLTGETLPDVVDLVAHSETVAIPASAVPGLSSRIAALEGILADGGTGTGSGIRNVSGTVTLDATPGIYEVYALDAATVNGVELVAGDAAVFRYLSGSWSWMIVGQHTTWQAPEPTAVTATAPTFTDADGTADDRYIIPTTTGVEYRKGGAAIAAGTYTPTAGESVTITAVALDGYTLTGTSSWSQTFSTSTAPIGVTATAPTWTDDAINGGGSWSTPTITGVAYSPASGTATPGQSVTVTATAQTGYQLSGTTSWQHTFPTAPAQPFTGATDNFDDAPDGTLIGRVTQTGGLTWANISEMQFVAPNSTPGEATGGKMTLGKIGVTDGRIRSIQFDYTLEPGTEMIRATAGSTWDKPVMLQVRGTTYKLFVGSTEVKTATPWPDARSGTARVVRSGTNVTVYRNGVELFTHDVGITPSPGWGVYIGSSPIATIDNIELLP